MNSFVLLSTIRNFVHYFNSTQTMKKTLLVVLAVWLLMPLNTFAQTYQALWKQVEVARSKDLPRQALTHLKKIETKAQKECAYGQLLKASLLTASVEMDISPDSLAPAIGRIERQQAVAKDPVLQMVYAAVLYKVYSDNPSLDNDTSDKQRNYRKLAMVHPELLANVKADGYEPLVVSNKDSKVFNHDLLSVVALELNEWQWLYDYYMKVGNCPAACIAASKIEHTIEGYDSLLATFGDYPEACELAISRYNLMSGDKYTNAERYNWLQHALKQWGTWSRADMLRNDLTSLTTPTFSVSVGHSIQEVSKSQKVGLTDLRNINQLTMRVYRTSLAGDTQLNPNNKNDLKTIKVGMKELTELAQTKSFAGHAVYDEFEDSLQLQGLPAGVYLLEFATLPQTEVVRSLYFVSGVRVLQQAQPDNNRRMVVVNATTGQPIKNATVRLGFRKEWNKPMTTRILTCNNQGEAIYSGEQRPSSVFAYTADDNYCPEGDGYGSYFYYERQYNGEHTNLFTDRAIYRPGQTVYATAIVWKELSAIDNAAVADKSLKFELRDANYKVVAEQQATTDRFGKCSVQFTLPTGKLNGRFSIRTKNGSIGFRVEEYKRPAFQVEFDEYKDSYQAGDTVRATAKAMSYAGVPIQDAKVHYVVKRRVAFWWMTYSRYWQGGYIGNGLNEMVISEGDATTAADGSFGVDMPLTMPDDLGRHTMFYHFVVDADVTDQAGETHQGTMSLPLGNKPTALTCDLPKQVRSDQMPLVTFARRNAAGKEICGKMKYRIDDGKWLQTSANAPTALPTLKSGKHIILAVCQNDTIEQSFVVFSLDDKRPATETHDWFYVSHEQFPADGSPVTLQVGSSDPNLHIVYSIFAGKKLLESGAVKKNGELINRQFTYREEYGNGLLLTYAWVKNGESYRHQQAIRRPMPDRKLKMQWTTFRDRLVPGQQEQWQLKINKPEGTPADASLLAVLYDKSLDALTQHQWSFAPSSFLSLPSTYWLLPDGPTITEIGTLQTKMIPVDLLSFSRFDDSIFPVYYAPIRIRGTHMYKANAAAPMLMEQESKLYDIVANDEAAGEVLKAKETIGTEGSDLAGDGAPTDSPVQVRENLNETAFCYPNIITDKDGNATLSFTLPESLTTWRFMGIANTADMLYGYIDGEAVAQKNVMIQPNIPRFIREGDKATISARLFNTTDHSVSGNAKLQLIDPKTEKVVYEQEQLFTLDANKSGAATFNVQCSMFNVSLLICKVVAQGDGFSDGEQHYLPILTNKEYVTKTVPITQHEAGVKTIDLTKLFPQGTDQQKLTIEYTNNPAWLMVQSLPALGQPYEHSAIDQAASYYSNLLAKHILDQNPQAKRVFEQWKQELRSTVSPSTSTLQSQLSKNEDLKDLILQETPWVIAADRESEQRQRLADFFDENGINNRLQTAIEKLKELQNGDGSFSWYPGMEGSTYITVAVEEMLARMQTMTSDLQTSDLRPLYDKAFNYIAKDMTEMVAKMKKEEKKGYRQTFPSFTALRWLYLCAIDGRTLKTDVKAANDYLIALLKKDIKRQTIYEKAMTAVVLAKRGEKSKAKEYVKSLKEYTVYTEEMGRYYDTRRAGYSWYDYKIPTEVAAIEAIQLVTPQDQQTVDEMRRWLLQEKRTQAWGTPINSVNAIYAFLNGNSQTLTTTQPATALVVDGTPVDTGKASAGIGYVKSAQPYNGEHTFTATKTSEGTSWGAVYAQFLQKTSDVEASQSGIKVTREIRSAEANSTLKVGQRIKVRITIESTRDLDFVQVVDHRAACMEPVNQLSGYRNGAYCSPKDNATHYFYGRMAKGKHVIETEYYIDRAGSYETGTCTVGCAYAPEFRATTPSATLTITE
jgi:uncharacterized protein YfaS (alpha-2-macroglobulin family)